MTTSPSNRGKTAEAKLRKEFEKLDASKHNFCYERIYDAHSSRGKSANARSGDFCLYYAGANMLIEVKEVDHSYRLPRPNFDTAQRARMRKRVLAGSSAWVAIYHTPDDTWRLLNISQFGFETTGSWDLRETPVLTLQQLIEALVTYVDNL